MDGGGGGSGRQPPPHDPLSAAMAEQHRRRQAELESRLANHVAGYKINLLFPASVFPSGHGGAGGGPGAAGQGEGGAEATTGGGSAAPAAASTASPPPLRTSPDFVNHRLLESGLLFDDLQSLGEATEAVARFVDDMNGTGCYDGVQVVIGRPTAGGEGPTDGADTESAAAAETAQPPPTNLDVILTEKRWYKLYVGGGIKHDGIMGSSGASAETLPRVQLETTTGLLNLSGCADVTTAGYTVDQTGSTTLGLSHDRPLFSCFKPYSPLANFILTSPTLNGSSTSLRVMGRMDTVDWECARSSRDRIRQLGVRVANAGHVAVPESATGPFASLEWSAQFRDVMPRRHPTMPYGCDASPEIVAQAGPSWKHSLMYQHRLNNSLCDDRYNPTRGVDAHWSWEVAGPPGDVGFVRGTGGAALHVPMDSLMGGGGGSAAGGGGGVSLHGCVHGGFIRPITYGGLCPAATSVSDRFYVGGPMQLRGFMPSGIGPRAETGGASTAGGDALGGDLFYTATVAASIPFPITLLRDNGVRIFAFANAGTLAGLSGAPAVSSLIRSTRASVGGGLAVGTPMGRLEATYAVPVRYGPRDARRSVQFGLGFSFG